MSEPSTYTIRPDLLYFRNAGEIDPRLVTIMGTNIKKTSNAIGQFGTGLKYAIAVIKRLGGSITIYSGETKLTFSATLEIIRDKQFALLHMDTLSPDGTLVTQPLGFTTELGAKWDPWMAYRELRCNAQDEMNGSVATSLWVADQDDLFREAGWTHIVVDCPEVLDAHRKANLWFLNASGSRASFPLETTPSVEIYPYMGHNGFFCQGVKVGSFVRRPKFTYNFTNTLPLSEDRTCDEYHATYELARQFYSTITNINLIRDVVQQHGDEETMEDHINWSAAWEDPSHAMIAVVEDLRKRKSSKLSQRLADKIGIHLPKEPLTQAALSREETVVLREAVNFLSAMGHTFSNPIRVVEDLDIKPTSRYLRDEGFIYIPKEILSYGLKQTAAVLLCEWINYELEYSNSASVEQWLLNKVINQAEELAKARLGQPSA